MNIKKDNNIKINSKTLKLWKKSFKYNILKDTLFNKHALFFYYDFIKSIDESKLKIILKNNNLQMIKIKKNTILNLLENKEYTGLKNILNNNIICITSKINNPENFFKKDLINSLNNISSIFLIAAWFNKKLIRPFEYIQLLNTNESLIKKTPIFLLKNIIYLMHFLLKNKKEIKNNNI